MSWHLVTSDDYILGDAALHYNTKNLKLLNFNLNSCKPNLGLFCVVVVFAIR